MSNEYFIAWWNVENLFDIEDSPDRSDKLQKLLKKELKGWDTQVLEKKLEQLSKIIHRMNDGKGPDILGVCEVENKNVMLQLKDKLNDVDHKYDVVHADTKDRRGIDVAFIYDKNKFEANEVFSHWIVKREATRDILQVNFKIKSTGKILVVIGNHWPSKLGGELTSDPYRMVAGETISYYHQRILEELGEDTSILAMGDFNDECFNRSITDYALSVNNKLKVLKAKNPLFYNLMWSKITGDTGTHFYDSFQTIDQFWISKGILKEKDILIKNDTLQIIQHDDMVTTGDVYKKPLRFGRPSDKLNINGYSDHFPICLVLKEK
jgi:hypothetical protein